MVVQGLLLLLQCSWRGHGLPLDGHQVPLPGLPVAHRGFTLADAGVAVLPARCLLCGPFARCQGRRQVLRHIPHDVPASEVFLLQHGQDAAGAPCGVLDARAPMLLHGQPCVCRRQVAPVSGVPHAVAHCPASGRLPVDRVHPWGSTGVARADERRAPSRRLATRRPPLGHQPCCRMRRRARARHARSGRGGMNVSSPIAPACEGPPFSHSRA
mmetsp:Transcript_42086/g.94983  ORF Transcript_42086/g.94983 Transcript_42086/m.94983 type:complete len:213 (+) Transcript_42086:200-838(+)